MASAVHLDAALSPVIAATSAFTHPYAPIMVLTLGVIAVVTVITVLTHVVGPSRRGRVKDETYEAGMVSIGDARGRFNVQFYVVAMLFLLFDVEVVFLWPWAVVFYDAAMAPESSSAAVPASDPVFLVTGMGVFIGLLVIGLVYEWGKGAFRWT